MNNHRPEPARPRLAVVLIVLAAAAAVCCFLLGLLGPFYWLFDLFSPFRVQYSIALLVCGAALLLLSYKRSALAVLAIAILMSATVLTETGWPSRPAQAATERFRFVTFNRYRHNDDFAGIGSWMQQSGADAVVVQEVYSAHAMHGLATALPQYPYVYARPGEDSDVALFSRWPILDAQLAELSPGGTNAVKATIDWKGKPITVMGVHLHWPMAPDEARLRDAELVGLGGLVRGMPGPLLVAGDFNITPWSKQFSEAVANSGLNECARGHGFINSWPSFLAPARIRIDHCLASPHWRAISAVTGPPLGSDHFAMIHDLELVGETTP